MNRFKFKYRVALLMFGFSLFYTQAAGKDVLGKNPNTRINTSAGFTDEDVNEKQIETVLNKHSNGLPLNAAEIKTLRTNINKLPVKTAGDRRPSISGRGQLSRDAIDLFFSEYGEGTSNNKYLEIYNGTGAAVDLSNYLIMQNSNGGPWDEYVDTLSGTLANGDVYVIANASADTSILAAADLTGSGICYFNGDDARALIKVVAGDTTVLDYIGSFPDDPGSGWDVAGVTNATKDHTLVRKSLITSGNTSWTTSAGTNTADSEWIVHDQNTWSYLGSHTMYVATLDTTYDITWHTEYSDPSETVCGSPVEFLLCSKPTFSIISSTLFLIFFFV